MTLAKRSAGYANESGVLDLFRGDREAGCYGYSAQG